MNDPKKSPVRVLGHLAYNWDKLNNHTPAVILNPDAPTADVLAWCWSEMVTLQAAATVLIAADGEISKNLFDALIAHRLGPVADVLEVVIERHCIDANSRAKAQDEQAQKRKPL